MAWQTRRACFVPLVAVGLVILAAAARLQAAEPQASKDEAASAWLRVVRSDAKEPIALQTATVRYTSADSEGLSVDLIGVVHVGDKAYYDALNRQFKQYDALLYELVAPKDARIQPGRGASSRHPVGALQNGLKSLLNLEHQLDRIDYQQQNFVHADMSPDEFSKTMASRNESFMQMLFRMMGQGIAQQSKQQAQGKSGDLDLVLALFDKNRPIKLKRIMAQQFEQLEMLTVGFNGPDGSTIITERNKVALDVLANEIKAGKKHLGIFYGAGHMEDMDKRLRDQFKLVPGEPQWLTAWDMRLPEER